MGELDEDIEENEKMAEKIVRAIINSGSQLLTIIKLIEKELIYELLLGKLTPAEEEVFSTQLKKLQKNDEVTEKDLNEAVKMTDEEKEKELVYIKDALQNYFKNSSI